MDLKKKVFSEIEKDQLVKAGTFEYLEDLIMIKKEIVKRFEHSVLKDIFVIHHSVKCKLQPVETFEHSGKCRVGYYKDIEHRIEVYISATKRTKTFYIKTNSTTLPELPELYKVISEKLSTKKIAFEYIKKQQEIKRKKEEIAIKKASNELNRILQTNEYYYNY